MRGRKPSFTIQLPAAHLQELERRLRSTNLKQGLARRARLLRTLEASLDSGESLEAALAAATEAAESGAKATVPLQARKGRASYLGERSIGHQDPGATSAALIMAALQQAVEQGR